MNSATENLDGPAFQMLSRLSRRLAHELNNPISAITSSVYLIQDIAAGGTVSASEIEPFLNSIQEECNAMKETVQEFAKFASTTSILPAAIDLSEFVRKRAEDLQREGLPVRVSIPEGQVMAIADAGALAFVLQTLAHSAAHAGAKEIHFSLTSNTDVEIRIADDRTPQPSSEELSSLFLSDASLEHRQGLGLKLPLVKRIVELHHGTLECSSKETKTEILIALPKSESSAAS
ncbi:MAG TPA: HAMP domain-containing sensor histidine kinase [Candidatus Kapabacteria bacterium]